MSVLSLYGLLVFVYCFASVSSVSAQSASEGFDEDSSNPSSTATDHMHLRKSSVLWWPAAVTDSTQALLRHIRADPSKVAKVSKRASKSQKETVEHSNPQIATTSARHPRAPREYDVPQIECPNADDGMERFACPTADTLGRYRCIDDHVLCDGFIDCPSGEDEDRQSCMFYKTTKAHLDVLADALLRWARGRYN